jgi:hypothetical protein
MQEYIKYMSIVSDFKKRLNNCNCSERKKRYIEAIRHFNTLAYNSLHV